MQQTTNTILMIRPVAFKLNEQTAINNYFQQMTQDAVLPETINKQAQIEFDGLVTKLREVGVKVIVVDDTAKPHTPDSIFPNNWISFHENALCVYYPMFANNRRLERRDDILDIIENEGFEIENIMDYSSAEEDEIYLEGTGSMVLDRVNKKAYCSLSARADEELFIEFCEDFDYHPVIFESFQDVNQERKPIYHTNVMMSIGSTFAILCSESIDDKKERKMVVDFLKADKKEIITITNAQMLHFAGNMLEVIGKDNQNYLVMSQSAFDSLSQTQITQIEQHARIISTNLTTIETHGGGSARCMMAEVFLPKLA
jgi:hypothetical protein